METVHVIIKKEQVLGKISPYLFGHFIEFMYDCITPGLHAQLLVSRGFEYPDGNGDGISDPWFGVGRNDSCEYSLDENNALSPSKSQMIRIFNHFDGYRGVAQNGMRLEKGQAYGGYLWLKSSSHSVCRVNLSGNDRKAFFTKDFQVEPGDWKKYRFEFVCRELQTDAQIEICLCSKGTLWLDQISLVPCGVPCGVWPAVIKKIQEIKPSVLRFPGGCFADCYHWQDGVGPVDFRPARENEHWGGTEENSFGTDEFIALCRYLGCEPMICINFGTGSPQEAANWVEYCNGDSSTRFGALRTANGHPEPYDVRWWDIGNEAFGDWEIGNCTAEEYAEKYLQFCRQMKAKDSSIRLIACAGDGNHADQSWNRTILKRLKGDVGVLGIHIYAPMLQNKDYDNAAIYYAVVGGAPKKYDGIFKACAETVGQTYGDDGTVKLGITEWNTSYHNNSMRECTLEAALCNAGIMNSFIRNCNSIELCNTSDLINGWPGGLIHSRNGIAAGTPTYYAIKMYVNAGVENYVACEYSCETYRSSTIGNIEFQEDIPFLDLVACTDRNGKLFLMAVNRRLDQPVRILIDGLENKSVKIQTLCSENVSDTNEIGNEHIVPSFKDYPGDQIQLLPHSVNVIEVLS